MKAPHPVKQRCLRLSAWLAFSSQVAALRAARCVARRSRWALNSALRSSPCLELVWSPLLTAAMAFAKPCALAVLASRALAAAESRASNASNFYSVGVHMTASP